MGQSSGEVIALTAVFTFLELLFVLLRFGARYKRHVAIGVDDYLIAAAGLLFVPLIAVPIFLQSGRANMGNHVQVTPSGEPASPPFLFQASERVIESCHVIPLALTKAGVVFFYRRIFRGPIFNGITVVTLVLIGIWGIAYFFSLLFLCAPIETYLRLGSHAPGVHCVDQVAVYYSLSISDFLVDFIIISIPIPFVWQVKMATRLKVGVSLAFMLGLLTIAASIVRMVTFIHEATFPPSKAMDYTYYTAPTSYWTMLESSLAIVSACLPTLRPMFHGLSPESVLHSLRSALSIGSLSPNSSNENVPRHMRRGNKDEGSSGKTSDDVEIRRVTSKAQCSSENVGPATQLPVDAIHMQKDFGTSGSGHGEA